MFLFVVLGLASLRAISLISPNLVESKHPPYRKVCFPFASQNLYLDRCVPLKSILCEQIIFCFNFVYFLANSSELV